jgi:hypothetical protein
MSGAGRWPVASSDEDFTEFLSGAPPAAARMFWRFIGLARDCGAVTFELQRSRVVLRGSKRIFASVRVSARGLAGHVNLARRIPPGGLIRKVEPLTKTLYFHAFAVSAIDDLDAAFALLLCEARDVGDDRSTAD